MTATITATAEPTATPPRVRLNVTTNQATITLYRVAQDGTKTVVRSYDGGPFPVSAGTLVAYDPEAPVGLPVSYTADGAGVTNSSVVTVTTTDVWFTHPGVPSRSQIVELASLSPRVSDANQSVRYPLGRKYPIVASDGVRKAPSYEVKVLTDSLAELGALDALLADLSPLLLQVPPSLEWGQASEYVTVGQVSMGRLVQIGDVPWREWTLPCSVVARPPGGSQVYNTYARSKSLYTTYGARKAAHATYGAAFNAT